MVHPLLRTTESLTVNLHSDVLVVITVHLIEAYTLIYRVFYALDVTSNKLYDYFFLCRNYSIDNEAIDN